MQVKVLGKVIGEAESWYPIEPFSEAIISVVFYAFQPVEAVSTALTGNGSIIINFATGEVTLPDGEVVSLLPLLSTPGL